jgi:hypothetical protein
MTPYYYAASPYTRYHEGVGAAYLAVCRAMVRLAEARVPAYSPIVLGHPVAVIGKLPLDDHDFWVWYDAPLRDNASALLVVTIPGWDTSAGVAGEIADFQRRNLPVVYWSPDDPADVIPLLHLI